MRGGALYCVLTVLTTVARRCSSCLYCWIMEQHGQQNVLRKSPQQLGSIPAFLRTSPRCRQTRL